VLYSPADTLPGRALTAGPKRTEAMIRCYAAILFATWCGAAQAQTCPDLTLPQRAALLDFHVYGDLPGDGDVLVRRGYVLSYDQKRRVPRWAAWHASPAYRLTPDRDVSRWGSFHPDPEIEDPVEHSDYNGLFASTDNFARGHIVPFYISGGDRDADGTSASDEEGRFIEDIDDACTVFEIMYMSNIAPQYHDDFNGPGALWNQLETTLRNLIDNHEEEFWVIAGSIFGENEIQFVGPANDQTIGVPDMFFKIVITREGPVGFLFAHRRQLVPEACNLDAELADCIVPISVIEDSSRLDFFSDLRQLEVEFESLDGGQIWAQVTD